MSQEKGKIVMGVSACLDCNRIVPGGVLDCPHCHSPNRKMAIGKDLQQLMLDVQATTNEGARRFATGDLDAAIKLTREAIGKNPWNATAHGNLGKMLIKRNELDEAAECLERAFYLFPSLVGIQDHLGLVSRGLNKPIESWRRYNFVSVFEFDTDKHAIDSIDILPNELLRRMEKPELTRTGNCSFLKFVGNPLTKAEIWYTVLALDACGFSKMAIGLPDMRQDEQTRVLKRFFPGRM